MKTHVRERSGESERKEGREKESIMHVHAGMRAFNVCMACVHVCVGNRQECENEGVHMKSFACIYAISEREQTHRLSLSLSLSLKRVQPHVHTLVHTHTLSHTCTNLHAYAQEHTHTHTNTHSVVAQLPVIGIPPRQNHVLCLQSQIMRFTGRRTAS